MKVSSVSEMRRLDRKAMDEFGIREELLMENAGEAAYFVLLKTFGIKNRKFIVICGAGNNGGDGLVVARKIHSNGGDVQIFVMGERERFKGAAKINLDIVSRLPIKVLRLKSIESLRVQLAHCDAIVDAIFGTGLARNVEGLYHDVIKLMNDSGKMILSLDIPSGIAGDTGKIMGIAVRADYTVSFGLPKIGNLLFPGYYMCGKLYVTHISFPPLIYEDDSIRLEINHPPVLPPRNAQGHKGIFGDVLFIAGSSNYFGAPYFSAISLLKAGGGYARLAAPKSISPYIATKGNEIVFIPQTETETGSISIENKTSLLEIAEDVDMVVLGPGLSLNEETQQLAMDLASEIKKPLLIDGDGITALCKDLEIIRRRDATTILTPHLGEMSKIIGMPVRKIDTDKVDILRRTAEKLKAIMVLKGPHSLIGYPNGKVFINMTGNSGMATAGSGDVLTGTIAAMYGLGLPVEDAVRKGVFIHGLAGDLASKKRGEDGITAQDILDYLPIAVKTDREGLDENLTKRYYGVPII